MDWSHQKVENALTDVDPVQDNILPCTAVPFRQDKTSIPEFMTGILGRIGFWQRGFPRSLGLLGTKVTATRRKPLSMFTELARRCGRKHPPSFRTSTLQHSEVLLPNVARPVTDAQKSFAVHTSSFGWWWKWFSLHFAFPPSERTPTQACHLIEIAKHGINNRTVQGCCVSVVGRGRESWVGLA